jgi:molybdopterin synthase sulfur carrier subunit
MNVRVQFFAQLRDIAGTSESSIELPPNSTATDLLETVYRQIPSLRPNDKTILVGVGVEFVDRNHVIQPDQTVSIMPPVQGG